MFFGELRQYTDRKIFIALIGIMVVAIGAAVGAILCLQAVLHGRAQSIQTGQVRNELQDLATGMGGTLAANRGYLLSGSLADLEAYNAEAKQIPPKLRQLKTDLRNPVSLSKLEPLTRDINGELGQWQHVTQVRQAQGLEAALAATDAVGGDEPVQKIRDTITRLIAEQSTLINQQRKETTEYGTFAELISTATVVVIILLASLVHYLFLKAIEAERELDRAKDEFVSLASHQLRTPATGIKSILSIVMNEDFGPLNERQHYFLGRAAESNERELRIIEELLNVAKADAGRLVLRPAELELQNLIESIISEQRRAIEAKGLKIEVKQPARPLKITGDGEKLHMAISNIVDNARKYTPEAGRIVVALHNRKGMAVIEIKDTGVGIDEADVSKIFDRFQRAQNMLAGTVEGTGLGLYLARQIAELHNGTIEVNSKKGEGTTFVLTLPTRRI